MHKLIKVVDGQIVEINGKKGAGVSQLNGFFGRRPGQSLSDFSKELSALTTDDKVQLIGGIVDGSFNY